MKDRGLGQSRARRWLTVLFTTALALFVLRELLTRVLDRSLATVETIVDDAIPGVIECVETRRLLREIRSETVRASELPLEEREDAAAQIDELWSSLDQRWAGYASQPHSSPNERAAQARCADSIAKLRAATAAVLASRSDRSTRTLVRARLTPATDESAEMVGHLIEVNAREASAAARTIVRNHERVNLVSLGLLCAVLGLSLAMAFFANRRLSKAERVLALQLDELDAFAGRVAHDLKGPLGPALVGVGELRRVVVTEEGRTTLGALERSITRFADVIDGLLAFARSGAAPEMDSSASLRNVVDEQSGQLRSLAIAERVELTFDVEPNLLVAASAVVVGSILDNLVRNAILHIEDPERRVVTVRCRGEAGAAVVDVTDTGPGIPADVLARLFRPFERGSSRRRGTGLGLATVKRLVEAHRGTVTVRTRVGLGSTFEVRVPLAEPSARRDVGRGGRSVPLASCEGPG